MKNRDIHDENEGLTFWEHLDELRGVVLRSIGLILFFTIIAFCFKNILFDYVILGPKNSDFITYRGLCKLGHVLSLDFLCLDPVSINLININLAGQFISHMTISIMAGFVLSSPFIVWLFWRFIKPALNEKELRNTRGAVLIISGLFILGVLFSYFIAVPLMINFLGNYQVSESVINQIALTSYTSAVTSICFLMGLIFEFPVIILFLTKIGIVTPDFLGRYRKHTIVTILIIAGLITPSPDVFSQLVVSVPLYLLYELSLQISRKSYRNPPGLSGQKEDQI